jgi:hypothetical protein
MAQNRSNASPLPIGFHTLAAAIGIHLGGEGPPRVCIPLPTVSPVKTRRGSARVGEGVPRRCTVGTTTDVASAAIDAIPTNIRTDGVSSAILSAIKSSNSRCERQIQWNG